MRSNKIGKKYKFKDIAMNKKYQHWNKIYSFFKNSCRKLTNKEIINKIWNKSIIFLKINNVEHKKNYNRNSNPIKHRNKIFQRV